MFAYDIYEMRKFVLGNGSRRQRETHVWILSLYQLSLFTSTLPQRLKSYGIYYASITRLLSDHASETRNHLECHAVSLTSPQAISFCEFVFFDYIKATAIENRKETG